MSGVKLVLCGVGGEPTGESHFRAHPEAKVTKARELRAQGWNLQAIADYLDGPHRTTVSRWISGKTRNKTVRVVARRVKEPAADSESLEKHASAMVSSGMCNLTSINRPKSTSKGDK